MDVVSIRKRYINNKKLAIAAAVIISVSLVASLAWAAYQHRFVVNPDGVAYISIAQHYLDANFQDAINAYWSPLLSWLMVPLLALGFAGQTAFAIVNFATVIFILFFGSYAIHRLTSRVSVAVLYSAIMLPFLFSVLSGPITPDGLVVAWVLIYIYSLWSAGRYFDRGRVSLKVCMAIAAYIGLLGALGYVTKLYIQPFFIATFISLLVLRFLLAGRHNWAWSIARKYIVFMVSTGLFYIIFSAAWVVPLSLKYHQLTIGSSYIFNSTPGGLPSTRMPLPPSNDSAVTNWEDPTLHIPYKSIDPPPEDILPRNKIAAIYAGIPKYISTVADLWVLMYMPIILSAVLLVLKKFKKDESRWIFVVLVSFTIYFAGYGIRGYDANLRYLWPLLLMSTVLVPSLVLCLLSYIKEKEKVRLIVAVLLIMLLPISMFLAYTPYIGEYFEVGKPKALQKIAMDIKEKNIIPQHAKIVADDFSYSTNISYFLNTKSYGTIKPGTRVYLGCASLRKVFF